MAEQHTKPRKKFAETGFGKFVMNNVPELAQVADQLITGGRMKGIIDVVRDQISQKADGGDDQAKAALLELEMQRRSWEKEMAELYVKELEIEVDDRKDARSLEKSYVDNGRVDYVNMVLSFVAVLAFGFALYIIAYRNIPGENRELFIHALGIIEGAMLMPVFTYRFSSTASSRRKTEIISKSPPVQ